MDNLLQTMARHGNLTPDTAEGRLALVRAGMLQPPAFQEFMKRYPPDSIGRVFDFFHCLVWADGTRWSLQGSRRHQSVPRQTIGPWEYTHFEPGHGDWQYGSMPIEAIQSQFAEMWLLYGPPKLQMCGYDHALPGCDAGCSHEGP